MEPLALELQDGTLSNSIRYHFGNLKRSGSGNHKTKHAGNGDEHTGEFRSFILETDSNGSLKVCVTHKSIMEWPILC
jgi:hypothetical protein